MRKYLSGIGVALLALSMVESGSAPAVAAPIQQVPLAAPDNGASATEVQYRRRHYRGWRRHRHGDAGAILGGIAAGVIIGGIIAHETARRSVRRYGPVRYGNAHIDWCFRRHRSYDVHSDTFQPNRGPRRYCNSPYN